MKIEVIIFCGVCLFLTSKAQTVPSSCTASTTVTERYNTDAQRLALRRVYADSSSYTDSVFVPSQWSDTSLRALIAVYNALTLPARDSVVTYYNLHTWIKPPMRIFTVQADKTLSWMQELKNGNINTGNSAVDSLISEFGLQIDYYYASMLLPFHEVSFETDTNYNIPIVANRFLGIPGVIDVYPQTIYGNGSDIVDSVTSNFIQLKYELRWEDCPSFCIYRHTWEFRVYNDCSVEYLGSSGDSITVPPITTAIGEVNSDWQVNIYPNPVTDQLNVELNQLEVEQLSIYNIHGKLIKEVVRYNRINVSDLNSGIYIVEIEAGGRTQRLRWLKM